jgi:hypothetical protein
MLIALVSSPLNESLALNERSNIGQAVEPKGTPSPGRKLEGTSEAIPSIFPPAKKSPYSDLFRYEARIPRDPQIRSTPLATPPALNPRIICGLTVWKVDPNIDPKIRLSLPDGGIDFKIRRVTPSTCRE